MATVEADKTTEIRLGILIPSRPVTLKVWLSEEEKEIACSWRDKTQQGARCDQNSSPKYACGRF